MKHLEMLPKMINFEFHSYNFAVLKRIRELQLLYALWRV